MQQGLVQDNSGYPEGFTPEDEDKLEQEAWRRSGGDIALWHHHRALLIGERFIARRGERDWRSYLRTKELKQYPAVENSVIQGWRSFVQKSMRIPPEKHQDEYAMNCALVFDWLRRKRESDELVDVFKRRANTFFAAAQKGDTEFFRVVGRLLGEKKKSNYLEQFDYANGALSRWLTDYYWLMPAKLASGLVAAGLDVPDKTKNFLAFKSRYKLKSHKPSLIDRLEKESERVARSVLTKRGKLMLG